MSREETRVTATFNCVDESGRSCVVEELTTFTVTDPLVGSPRELPGSVEYVIQGSRASVNEESDGSFVVVQTDEVLRRV